MSDFMTKISSVESLLRKGICAKMFVRFATDVPIVVSKFISYLTGKVWYT